MSATNQQLEAARQSEAARLAIVTRLEEMWQHGRFHCECGANFGVNDYDSNTVTCPKCGNQSSATITDYLQDGGAIDV